MLLVGFQLLRHGQQIDLVARLLRSSSLLLFVGAPQQIFSRHGRLITPLYGGHNFGWRFVEFGFQTLQLRVNFFDFGPFRRVSDQQRIAFFFERRNAIPQLLNAGRGVNIRNGKWIFLFPGGFELGLKILPLVFGCLTIGR